MLEPFYPRCLPFLKVMFSQKDKKNGLCENIFSLKKWKDYLSNFELLNIEFYPPYRLKKVLPCVDSLFKYITGGWFTLLARHK